MEENEIIENDTVENNTTVENEIEENTVENIIVSDVATLDDIHNDLIYTNAFLIFFIVVVLCVFSYKFFDMFFKI